MCTPFALVVQILYIHGSLMSGFFLILRSLRTPLCVLYARWLSNILTFLACYESYLLNGDRSITIVIGIRDLMSLEMIVSKPEVKKKKEDSY